MTEARRTDPVGAEVEALMPEVDPSSTPPSPTTPSSTTPPIDPLWEVDRDGTSANGDHRSIDDDRDVGRDGDVGDHGDEFPDDEPHSGLPPAARAFFDWVVVVGIALLVAVGVRTFVLAHFQVEGSSMLTTLTEGDRVFVNRLSYRFGEPSRGDVVVLHQINGVSERDLIKRVVALPGEEVAMTDCVVSIDGRELIEPYLDPEIVTPTRCGRGFEPVLVPEDHVWVMGDNRPGSQDSRDLGMIPYDDLVGRAFVVFWPRSDWRWL